MGTNGTAIVRDLAWGTHLCQFFESPDDLVEVLVPYFASGLERGDGCLWIVSDPLGIGDARRALATAVRDVDRRIRAKQIEILSSEEWYLRGGGFRRESVLKGWLAREAQALRRGFGGLRLSGNASWLTGRRWKPFMAYEGAVQRVLADHRIIALCSYPAARCGPAETVEVVRHHDLALVKRGGTWDAFASPDRNDAASAADAREQRYRDILERVPIHLAAVDAAGRFTAWNEYSEKLFGYTKKEAIGTLTPAALHTSPRGAAEVLRRARVDGIFDGDVELRHKDGRRIAAHLRVIPHRDRAGAIVGYCGFAEDFTDRMRAEEQSRALAAHLNAVLNSIAEGYIAIDREGRLATINRAALDRFFRRPSEELLGKVFWEECPEYARAELRRFCRGALRRRRPAHFETASPQADAWFEVHAYPRASGLELYLHDITERRRSETALKAVSRFPEENTSPVLRIDRAGTVLYANPASRSLAGKGGIRIGGPLPAPLRALASRGAACRRRCELEIAVRGRVVSFMVVPVAGTRYVNLYGRDVTDRTRAEAALRRAGGDLEKKVARRTAQLLRANEALSREVATRKKREVLITAENFILDLLAKKTSRREYLAAVAGCLRRLTGCRCVGIRVAGADGGIPYEASAGFSRRFLAQESDISIASDACVCTRAISRRFEPSDDAALRPRGSFCINDTASFVAGLDPCDRRKYRGACMAAGFSSVAVIPIVHRGAAIAAIHLADRRPGRVPPAVMELVESLTRLIGEGIKRFNLEDDIRRSTIVQGVVSTLLRSSLGHIDIDRVLRKALNVILSIDWLGFEKRGAVFLSTEDGAALELRTQRGLSRQFARRFRSLRLDSCLCGRAVARRAVEFRPCISAAENLIPAGMRRLGHYCIPLVADGKAIGVISIFLRSRCRRDPGRERFLLPIANAVAAIVKYKRTQMRLHQTNEILERVFSSTNFLIAYLDARCRYIRVNQAYADADGRPPEFFAGKNHFDLFPGREHRRIFADVIATGRPFAAYAKPFASAGRPGGQATYRDWSLHPVTGVTGAVEGLVLLLVDVTKRTQAEEELRKTQTALGEARRLSDIGTLAATVAHELRNPLGVIRTAAYNIRRKAQNPALESHLANIDKKVIESDQIISNLLFYSRIRPPQRGNVAIGALLEECVQDVARKFPKHDAAVERRWQDLDGVAIEADVHQIREVFANVLNNAFEALPEKRGRIAITGRLDPAATRIAVTIEDTGAGIAPDALARIGEPFFTTKISGTGLGLTVSRQIVKLHAGSLEFRSEEGRGTAVTVTLPVTANGAPAPADARAETARDAAADAVRGRGSR